ncbi:MAG: YciI family protein [Pseudomonadota bacterium]
MEYMLLICSNESDWQKLTPAQTQEMVGAYRAYTEALEQAGVLRGSNRLRPASSATRVRVNGGRTEVLNGPYAETREQLGGYYLIDVPDLDAAIQWAARCPSASYGTVEVRPVWPAGEY